MLYRISIVAHDLFFKIVFSDDAEMGEATESNQPDERQETQNTESSGQEAAILSTASIAESIVESVLASSSRPQSTTTPSFSGLLTLLSPVSTSTPTLPLQEPPVSSVPAVVGGTLTGAPSAPATPQTTSVTGLPPFPSPTTSTPVPTPFVPSTNTTSQDVINAVTSTLSITDTEMIATSPLPTVGPQIMSGDNVESLSTQEETPMSVSPPEYPSQSPELLASSTPPVPGVPPREAWEDPSMVMQQDPQDQGNNPPLTTTLPVLVTPSSLRRESQDRPQPE